MVLNWQIKHYNDLTLNEFHDIIALRLKAFVVEQSCAYLDLDGRDKKCYHLICRNGMGDVVATARILPQSVAYSDACAIGRVVIDETLRRQGLGHDLMDRAIEFCLVEFGKSPIRISAQKHLESYYAQHQFASTGKEYLEDDIPHVEMLFKPE